jgi:hypothetical protein
VVTRCNRSGRGHGHDGSEWGLYAAAVDGIIGAEARAFVDPARMWSRDEVLARPSPVPDADGVYGWWFRRLPPLVDASGCCQHEGLALLYVGISPRRPPRNGRVLGRQGLRRRLETHYAGNAEGSTLRKTLGCLLAGELGLELRRVGSGRRRTLAAGEPVLSEWMEDNTRVSWVVRDYPWELEDVLIASLDLPLNLEGNSRNRFHPELTQTRARWVAHANSLPVLPNPGIGGRPAGRS